MPKEEESVDDVLVVVHEIRVAERHLETTFSRFEWCKRCTVVEYQVWVSGREFTG